MRVVIGLGSSVGPRRALLELALDGLARTPGLEPLRVSRLYWSPPAGGVARGDFLNAALCARWRGDPLALLDRCLAIEARLGRRRRTRWADRTADLDLLWVEGLALDGPRLTLPHPRLAERAFALAPLVEACPDAADPRTGVLYRDLPAPKGSPIAVIGALAAPPRGVTSSVPPPPEQGAPP